MSYRLKTAFTFIWVISACSLKTADSYKTIQLFYGKKNHTLQCDLDTLEKIPKYADMIHNLNNEDCITENLSDEGLFDNCAFFFHLLCNNEKSTQRTPSIQYPTHSFPNLSNTYDYLELQPITAKISSNTHEILSQCAANYVRIYQKKDYFFQKTIAWLLGIPYTPTYNWQSIIPLIKKTLPQNYLTDTERTSCLFTVYIADVMLKEYKNIQSLVIVQHNNMLYKMYSTVIKWYYSITGRPSFISLINLLNDRTYPNPSFLDICKNEGHHHSLCTKEHINNTDAKTPESNPYLNILKSIDYDEKDEEKNINEIIKSCTIPKKTEACVKTIIASLDSPTTHEPLHLTYIIPTLTFLQELEKLGTLYRNQSGMVLHSYPGLAETYLSLTPHNSKDNFIILRYYEQEWNKKEWDKDDIKSEPFHCNKYPPKKLKLYTELFEYITQKKHNLDDIKKRYSLYQWDKSCFTHEYIIQKFYEAQAKSATMIYLLKLPECNKNPERFS
jgi:hypothetical protein